MQLNLTRLQTKLKADMVSAWLMDDAATDQRLPHQKVPNVVVSMKDLKELGLLTWKVCHKKKFLEDGLLSLHGTSLGLYFYGHIVYMLRTHFIVLPLYNVNFHIQ